MTKTTAKRAVVPPALKGELASMSTNELEAVAKLTASLLGGKYVPKDKVLRAETGGQHARAEAFYNELANQYYSKTRARSKPFQILLSNQDKMAKSLLVKHKEFEQFIDDATTNHELTEAERLKFYAIGANLIAAALVKSGLTFNMNTLIGWVSNAPSLFNAQFPHYIGSGLLHIIVAAYLQKTVQGKKGALVELKTDEEANKKGGGRSQMLQNLRSRKKNQQKANNLAEYNGQ
jgi:hypothetical protein